VDWEKHVPKTRERLWIEKNTFPNQWEPNFLLTNTFTRQVRAKVWQKIHVPKTLATVVEGRKEGKKGGFGALEKGGQLLGGWVRNNWETTRFKTNNNTEGVLISPFF
jgi:hypothetical protein